MPVHYCTLHPIGITTMKHLIALTGSIAASQTNTPLTPVNDTLLATRGNTLVADQKYSIRRAFLTGLNLTEARLNIPSLRAITLPRLYPVNSELYPVDDPPMIQYEDRGPEALATEGIGVDVSTDATAADPHRIHSLLWLGNSLEPAPRLPIYTLKASLAATVTTGNWINATPTFVDDLPAGKYALVGADIYGAGVVAARFSFPGFTMRPGILCQQVVGEFMQNEQRFGNNGLFGVFSNNALFTVDILGVTGASAQTCYFDLQKIG